VLFDSDTRVAKPPLLQEFGQGVHRGLLKFHIGTDVSDPRVLLGLFLLTVANNSCGLPIPGHNGETKPGWDNFL